VIGGFLVRVCTVRAAGVADHLDAVMGASCARVEVVDWARGRG
jgi:hypothetical protein